MKLYSSERPHTGSGEASAGPHMTLVSVHRQILHTLVLEHVSPATRLLEKRRQMFEVQEALEQQKQDYARKVPGP